MRLSNEQIQAIRQAAQTAYGDDAAVWLFGSRVNDNKAGGDIDLLVRPASSTAHPRFSSKIRMLVLLERLLGERKIDLVVEEPNDSRPIVAVARATGVQIQ